MERRKVSVVITSCIENDIVEESLPNPNKAIEELI